MAYFKYSVQTNITENVNGINSLVQNSIANEDVISQYYNVAPIVKNSGSNIWQHKASSSFVTINAGTFWSNSGNNWTFGSNIRTGNISASASLQYGDGSFLECDVFSVLNEAGSSVSFAMWKDAADHNYVFTCNNVTNTNYYASLASDNPNLAALNASFVFPVIKDFGANYRTVLKQLNAPSSNYVIQPIVAFGVKTPIYSITGGNDSDMPLFSEIEVNGTKYFTIGTNYCVKM